MEESGGLDLGWEGFEVLAFCCCLAWVLGLRLRARARFSRLESEDSGESVSSSEMGVVGDVCCLAAERVIGAK